MGSESLALSKYDITQQKKIVPNNLENKLKFLQVYGASVASVLCAIPDSRDEAAQWAPHHLLQDLLFLLLRIRIQAACACIMQQNEYGSSQISMVSADTPYDVV